MDFVFTGRWVLSSLGTVDVASVQYVHIQWALCRVLGWRPGIFYAEPAPASTPGKREHNFEIFLKLTTNSLKYV